MVIDETKMKDLEEKVERLTKLTEQLVYAITGSSSMGVKGLIERIKQVEQVTEDHKEEIAATHKFLYEMLDGAEKQFSSKFEQLNKAVNEQLSGHEAFKKDWVKFKSQFDIYVGVFTSKTTWVFIFRFLGLVLMLSLIIIAWNKRGFDFAVEMIKKIF